MAFASLPPFQPRKVWTSCYKGCNLLYISSFLACHGFRSTVKVCCKKQASKFTSRSARNLTCKDSIGVSEKEEQAYRKYSTIISEEHSKKKILELYSTSGLQPAAAFLLSLDQRGLASTELFHVVIRLCCREGDVLFGLKLAEELVTRQEATAVTFRELVRLFVRQRNLSGIRYLWQYCKRVGVNADLIMYSCYVYCLVGGNLLEEATAELEEFLNKPEWRGLEIPFQTSFDWLVRKLLHEKNDIAGWLLFKRLHERGFRSPVVTFNIILDYFGKRRNLEGIQQARNLMEQSGLLPDCVTFNTLIKAYGLIKRHDLAEAALEQQTSQFGPQLVGFNTLMNSYCEDRNLSRVLELFERLRSLQLSPDLKTHSTVIKGRILMNEDPEIILKCFRQMKRENIITDLKLAYSILTFCIKHEYTEGVLSILTEMKLFSNCLDAAVISRLMDTYGSSPNGFRICEMLKENPSLLDEHAVKQLKKWEDALNSSLVKTKE
eukprot:jgi/Galph1/2615/GphlegSOOS_G1292.1